MRGHLENQIGMQRFVVHGCLNYRNMQTIIIVVVTSKMVHLNSNMDHIFQLSSVKSRTLQKGILY